MSVDDPRDRERHPAAASSGLQRSLPGLRFDHLIHLTHAFGVWEHAEHTTPRVAHGFCTDDNARALIVVSREDSRSPQLDDLAATYLGFVLDARMDDGVFHNRRGHDGAWLDDGGSDDSQGRAWWALGVAARRGRQPWMRDAALATFETGTAFESEHLRANAFGVLGAVEFLAVVPGHPGARGLLRRWAEPIAAAAGSHVPWFESRLTYDNARLPEALLAAGATLGDARMIRMGLRLLAWLIEVETNGDHFSFAPHGGWTMGDERPGFDQQPVEAAAMADACHRAWVITGDAVWQSRGIRAAQWLVGHNDTRGVLYDEATGGTRDGLMRGGVNDNQGAESTLAGLAALQVAASLWDEPAWSVT